jgi:hypothetical protein
MKIIKNLFSLKNMSQADKKIHLTFFSLSAGLYGLLAIVITVVVIINS